MKTRVRFVPVPSARIRSRGVLAPYVEAIAKNPGRAVVVPLNGSVVSDIRASLYTLIKRKGLRVHVYRGHRPDECIAWVDRETA